MRCASIHSDPLLRAHEHRTDRELEETHKRARLALQPISQLPELLEPFTSALVEIGSHKQSATGLSFQKTDGTVVLVSVAHIAENRAIGDVFRLNNNRLCKLAFNGLDDDCDCAIFKPQETTTQATIDEFGALTEESVLLLIDQGEFFFLPILVDVESATFAECTVQGYCGLVVSCDLWGEWGVSGIHVGEGRILEGEKLLPYLDPDHRQRECSLPSFFPHVLKYYTPQIKRGTPLDQIHSQKIPSQLSFLDEEIKVFLAFIENNFFFSHHTLYGRTDFSNKEPIVGRHIALSERHSLKIAEDQLSKKGGDLLTVIGEGLDWEVLQKYIEQQRNKYSTATGQNKSSPKFPEDASALGISLVRQYTSFNGTITQIVEVTKTDNPHTWEYTCSHGTNMKNKRTFTKQGHPQIEVKFEEGLAPTGPSKKPKHLLFLSHCSATFAKK